MISTHGMKRSFHLLIVLLLLFVVGCKVELYSGLTEQEANEMLALLLGAGMGCDKAAGKENTFSLSVDKKNMAKAVDLLTKSGLPRDRFVSFGDVFKKEGLISSPLEERARYVFALSQELSKTISDIEGVLVARVHIVIPESDPLNERPVFSSASVFIKHNQDADISSNIPQIKTLVVNGVENLVYDNVAVVLFPAKVVPESEMKPKFKQVAGLKIAVDSIKRFWLMAGGALFLLFAVAGTAGYLVFFRFRKVEHTETDQTENA